MVDDAQAEAYARQVFGKRADRGFIDDFRYRRIYDIDDSSNDFLSFFWIADESFLHLEIRWGSTVSSHFLDCL